MLITVCLCSCDASRDSLPDQFIEPLEESLVLENANKLGPLLKMRLLDDTQDAAEMLNLFVQITGVSTDVLRDQLGDLDAEIRTEAGDVLTVTLPADQLQKLAALDSVVYVELSAPLSTEDRPP